MYFNWVDATRGFAILLVVIGHAWRGIEASVIDLPPRLFDLVDSAIYAFHMPLFFSLSGLLFIQVLSRNSFAQLLSRSVWRLLWPLAIWTWIFAALKLLAQDFQNGPLRLEDFPIVPVPAQWHFWFLWALFLVQVSVAMSYGIMRRWGPRVPSWFFWAAVCAGGYVLLELIALVFPDTAVGVRFLPHFLVGCVLGRWRIPPIAQGYAVVGMVAFAVCLTVALSQPRLFVLEMLLVLLTLAIVRAFDSDSTKVPEPILRFLRRLGQFSLVIFVAHTIFSAVTREGLLVLGYQNPWLHLGAGVFTGALFPILLFNLLARFGLTWFFGLGLPRTENLTKVETRHASRQSRV